MKSITSGYASFDYELTGYEQSDLVKVQILINEEPVDALAFYATEARRNRGDGRFASV